MSETTLQPFAQDLMSLETKEKELSLEIANLEAELVNSELYIKLRDKKEALAVLQKTHEEKERDTIKAMVSIGLKSAEFFNRKFTLVQTPWAVEVLDETKIPKEYFKEKVTTSLDKKLLGADLKDGKSVDGVILKVDRRLRVTDKDTKSLI